MYRGKNQDYYISGEIQSSILNRHGRGGIPPSILKGSSLGILSIKKRGMAFFWGIKKYIQFYIGERMYRGKNV